MQWTISQCREAFFPTCQKNIYIRKKYFVLLLNKFACKLAQGLAVFDSTEWMAHRP